MSFRCRLSRARVRLPRAETSSRPRLAERRIEVARLKSLWSRTRAIVYSTTFFVQNVLYCSLICIRNQGILTPLVQPNSFLPRPPFRHLLGYSRGISRSRRFPLRHYTDFAFNGNTQKMYMPLESPTAASWYRLSQQKLYTLGWEILEK